jgi:predicted phage terminase large subunit-like protein
MTAYMPRTISEKQALFLILPTREAFYGGAAGGGKSEALYLGALQYVDTPGYAALLLRRTYGDLSLPGALMDRARERLTPMDAKWDEKAHTWRFPAGATLTFGYLEHEADKFRYQGAEFQYIGFDELTQFSETQYRYMASRLRRLQGVNIPLRLRAASNPGGLGHDWVKQRFITEQKTHHRPFIPARMADNPYLDIDSYRESLAVLDPVTRAQLENGDWEVRNAGSMFRREWFQIVPTAPAGMRKVRYWDRAATTAKPGRDPDWTAGCLLGVDERQYYLVDMRRFRGTPGDNERLIRQTAEVDGKAVPVWAEEEGGSSGKDSIDHYRDTVLPGWAFRGNRVTGSKAERAAPVSSQAEAGNVKLVAGPWVGAFLDEIEAFPAGSHDDQVDALSGAFEKVSMALPRKAICFQG